VSRTATAILLALLGTLQAAPAGAQSRLTIGGFATIGTMSFAASESFDAVLGGHRGLIWGGGARVGLPLGGLFAEVGAWRFGQEGERVFISGSEVFPLGIPVEVTITPIEITGGWRFRNFSATIVPYAGGGWSSYRYQETSRFADASENVDERFSGLHLLGGVELKLQRWIGVAGELAWTSVPDSIGVGGASGEFSESDLGGTSLRLKVTIGR
jgi:hypothetical protein